VGTVPTSSPLADTIFSSATLEFDLQLPKVGFFSHTLKIDATWPELFASGSKVLPYQHYRSDDRHDLFAGFLAILFAGER
jgi:hypothetical protein